jgi:hypothetical protein
MGKTQLEWLDSMLETYGKEIDALDGKPPRKPAGSVVTP